jgi:DNA primase
MNRGPLLEILEELEVDVVNETATGWLLVHCPLSPWLHASGRDRNPDCFIKIDPDGISGFHCFACKSKGRLATLARKLEHYRKADYRKIIMRCDAAETPDDFGSYEREFVAKPPAAPLDKVAYMSMYPTAWDETKSRDYLQQRGISRKTSEKLDLLFDPEESRVLFPVFDYKGDLFGFSGRSVLTKQRIEEINEARLKRGVTGYRPHRDYNFRKECVLLGEHLVEDKKPMAIFEGLFAYAHAHEIGAGKYANPVATLGSSCSNQQKEILVDHGCALYWFYDPDLAGDIGLFGPWDKMVKKYDGDGAVDKLKSSLPCFVPTWPEGLDDPDEMTLAEFKEMMDTAELAG